MKKAYLKKKQLAVDSGKSPPPVPDWEALEVCFLRDYISMFDLIDF